MKKYQIVYKDLEKAIHCQKYQVGDFLPTEQELVETFNSLWRPSKLYWYWWSSSYSLY